MDEEDKHSPSEYYYPENVWYRNWNRLHRKPGGYKTFYQPTEKCKHKQEDGYWYKHSFPLHGSLWYKAQFHLTYLRTMSSKNLEISPCSEAKVTSRARQREANCKLFRPWTKTKRMPFLKHENSTTPTLLVALQRAGTKFVSYAGVTFSSSRRMVAKKAWFGWPS